MTDHLAKAKDYIAKGDDYYAKAAAEIVAWLGEDASRTHRQAADDLGVSRQTVDRLVKMVTEGSPAVDWQRGSHATTAEIQVGANRLLSDADDEQVKEIVAALPTEAVERVMHAATSDLGQRHRPVRDHKPVSKSLFQRFADHCFTGWKLQDEMQDQPPPTGDELIRFRTVAEANLAFAQVTLKWLETGDFDDQIAQLLDDARESA